MTILRIFLALLGVRASMCLECVPPVVDTCDNCEDWANLIYQRVAKKPNVKFVLPLPASWICIEPKVVWLSGELQHLFVEEPMSFVNANSYCRDRNMILLFKIPTEVLQNEIVDYLGYANTVFKRSEWWIGLHDSSEEGTFQWVSGYKLQPTDYNNWNPGLQSSHSDQDCVKIDASTGYWDVDSCDKALSFVCQRGTPASCTTPNGPHSKDCLTEFWGSIGCAQTAQKSPDNLNSAEFDEWSKLPYNDLLTTMQTIKQEARVGSIAQFQNCYEIPPSCPNPTVQHVLPLSEDCIVDTADLIGCNGSALPSNIVKFLSMNPVENMLTVFQRIKTRSARSDLHAELCHYSGLHEVYGGMKVGYELTATTFHEAVDTCQSKDDYSPALENSTVTTWVLHKLIDAGLGTGITKWWIGLKGVNQVGGSYVWSTGDPLLSACNTFSKPLYTGPVDIQDCVPIDANDHMQWVFEDCNAMHGFMCQKEPPVQCSAVVGDLSMNCLTAIWTSVGCTEDGWDSPKNLSTDRRSVLSSSNYVLVHIAI